MHGPAGEIIYFNRSACRILGLTANQLLGKSSIDPYWKTLKEDGSPFPRNEHPAMVTLRTGSIQKNIVMGVTRPEGPMVWIQVNSYPITEGRVVATFVDITDRIFETRRLEEAQQVARIGSWSFRVSDGRISWTDQMFNIFPFSIAKGIPSVQEQSQAIHPSDRVLWNRAVNRSLQDGAPFVIRFRVMHSDRLVWVEARGQGQLSDEGKVVSIYGTCQDISEQIIAEQEASFIADSLKLGIFKWDIPNNVLVWDRNNFEVFEVDPASFENHFDAWKSTLTDESRDHAMSELQAAMRGEKEFNTHFKIRTPSGAIKYIAARGEFIRDEEGRPIKMFGFNWDATREAQMEQELNRERTKSLQTAKLASLGEMAAAVAHEINNPLAIISGAATLIVKKQQSPEMMVEKMEMIRKSVERIERIVSGLKRFSRTTTERNSKIVALSEVVKEAVALPELKAQRLNIQLQFRMESQLQVDCDPLEIEQVMINLINNAIDAVRNVPDRKILVETYDVKDQAVFAVSDWGPGIAAKIRDRIFEPFFTTKKVGEGTGLGLSIVKGILDDHKATIQLVSEKNPTKFEVKFYGNSCALPR